MTDFYITLPSNVVTEVGVRNTPTDFKTRLPEQLIFRKKWSVGLHEILIAGEVLTVPRPLPIKVTLNSGEIQEYTLPKGTYSTPTALTQALNRAVAPPSEGSANKRARRETQNIPTLPASALEGVATRDPLSTPAPPKSGDIPKVSGDALAGVETREPNVTPRPVAPTTPAPTTPAPTTPAPTTPAPTTPAPTTPAPTTPAPAAPTTPAPTTPAPTTPAPTTPAPTTPAPTTPAPTTPAPTTPAPTTPAPTTPAPTTPAPTPRPTDIPKLPGSALAGVDTREPAVTPTPPTPAPTTPAPTTPAPTDIPKLPGSALAGVDTREPTVTPAPTTPAPSTPAPTTPAPTPKPGDILKVPGSALAGVDTREPVTFPTTPAPPTDTPDSQPGRRPYIRVRPEDLPDSAVDASIRTLGQPLLFIYDDPTGRMLVNFDVGVVKAELAPDIAYMCGLASGELSDSTLAPNAPDCTNGKSLLYIYSDLCGYSVCGNQKTNLLRVIPFPTLQNSSISQSFQQIRSVPVRSEYVDSIRIQILDALGNKVHIVGYVCVVLQLRKEE